MIPLQRLERAWVEAGYPKEYLPKGQFEQVADAVAEAFANGAEDFVKAGWQKAGVDFPFAPSHPRYQVMLEAYRRMAEQ